MTPEVWQRVKDLVADALDQPEAERESFVYRSNEPTAVRREAESMLAQSAERLESCANDLVANGEEAWLATGKRIGAYRIVRELGRGGMGAVYLAERADGAFQKRVAIKILKRGTDTDEVLRRFRGERQILARLNHPSIGSLLDGGETDDGLPFFVMEYVDGKPITTYAHEHQLTISQRLSLFRVVCSAIGYAHQNLVIHRDLKPTNVLVTNEGDVKLLDFGIAKLLDDSEGDVTMTMHRVMTPEYASPEQVRGHSVTTVSDVYSLGVLLYELLTGERPYKLKTRSQSDISKAICEQEPNRPSTAICRAGAQSPVTNRKHLRGDLDNIVLKALRKEPGQRYVSVDQLSADIRRHLEGLPVRARKITAAYRASKFVQRYKFSVAAALLLALALVVGSVATAWQARVAQREKTRAERRFADVRKIANSLMIEFHNSIKDLPGALEARQLVTRRAVEYLDSLAHEAADDPSLKSELAAAYSRIGSITFDTQQAMMAHRKAMSLNESLVLAAPNNRKYREQLAECYGNVSDQMKISGNSTQSVAYARKALLITHELASGDAADNALSMNLSDRYLDLAIALLDRGEAKEAVENSNKALEILQRTPDQQSAIADKSHNLAVTCVVLATAFGELRDYSKALEYADREMNYALPKFESDSENSTYRRDMWSACFYRASARAGAGDSNGALADFEKAKQLMELLSTADPADNGHRRWLAFTCFSLAETLKTKNEFAKSIENYRTAISISEQLVAADSQRFESQRDLVRMYGGLADALSKTGDNKRALELWSKALPIAERNSNHDLENARITARLAAILSEGGDLYRKAAEEQNSASKRKASLQSARNCYQRSLAIWQNLQRAGKPDNLEPEEVKRVERAFAQCEAALN